MSLNLDKLTKYSILIVLFGIIILSFIQPLLKKQKENNWEIESKEFLFNSREKIQDEFNKKSKYLISNTNSFIDIIQKSEKDIFATITNNVSDEFYLHLFDKKYNLKFWSEKRFLDTLDNILINKIDQTFFITQRGKTYLTHLKTIIFKNEKYYLLNAILIEDLIVLKEKQNTFIDELKEKYSADIEFVFSENANMSNDGRKYSFPILNNYKNKIAVCSINYPTLSYELEKIGFYTNHYQNILILILFILIFGKINNQIKNKLLLKNILIGFELIGIRIFLFLAGIPSAFIENDLTNPVNFSSRFGYGIVSSPIELFLTASLILYLIYTLFKIEKFNSIKLDKKKIPKAVVILIISFFLFIFFLIWRGFGATIRSIIFDSTIRYFKEFNLIPEPVVILMTLNILLIGLIFFLIAILFLKFIVFLFNNKFKNEKYLLSLFVGIQLIGFLFDYIQKQPQGTFLIRIIFISFSFLTCYLWMYKERKFLYYLYILVFSSILSVTLLNFYNSELEKESLKIYANDIARVKKPQVSFMIYQTIENYSSLDYHKINDFDVMAFQLWKTSLIKTEDLTILIRIYDVNKNILGEFSNTNGFNNLNYILSDELKINKIENPYNNKNVLYGIKSVNIYEVKYYLLVAVAFKDDIPEKNILSVFRNDGIGITSSLNKINVLTFYYDKYGLNSSIDLLNIDESSINILNKIKQERIKEKWLNIKINHENYLVFSLLEESPNPKLICVAKPVKSFSWNLTDFFKIFFFHVIYISLFVMIYFLMNYNKIKSFIYSFRMKLSFTLIIVSLIPIIIISNYVRSIIDNNNEKIVFDNLKSNAFKITNLIIDDNYETVYEQIKVNFNIYKNEKIKYSTLQNLVDLGLINNILNPFVYKELIQQGNNIFYTNYYLNGEKINGIYIKHNDIILEVNDFENSQLIYLSKYDFDIFLFGIISFLIVVMIIVSYLFSYQISKPIHKLNIVTNAVANGDLSLKVEINSKDEFSELANAFNNMTQKIRENQLELAQFERESAWKEMAKQVAHEIKNPLTPMKLLIQQLIIAYNDKSDKFNEIFNKVTQTILNQIETLKNIASEFSNFARMPNLNLEKIDLLISINEVINLFAYQNKLVKLINYSSKVFIYADKDHLKRTLINLIRNSFQANANTVQIIIEESNNQVLIRIKDNGMGISSENIDKIFTANFSTKERGMGIGLNMARQFIENINGKIFVEETSSMGTTIQIKLPLIKDE